MQPNPKFDLRPEIETFSHGGCTVTLVDPARILAASAGAPVEMLRDASLADPVRAAGLSVVAEGQTFFIDAVVRTGRDPKSAVRALGNDPIGVLLAKRTAAGDPWATRVVDGVSGALAEVTKRLGWDEEPPGDGEPLETATRVDALSGLKATMTSGGTETEHWVKLRASVPRGEMSVSQLQGACRLLIDVLATEGTVPATLTLSANTANSEQVTLEQVGGLDPVVTQLREIAASFRHPQALARWGAQRPQGMLLFGPPGTGKTMLARALANEIGARFREIRTTEILDKWLGASEKNIQRIFRDARRYREPTVMLFDEFDSIIGYAGQGGDAAASAINSVAGIFKQEMNTLIEANPNVFVVATTNFPHRIDKSLIRSGRFDVKLSIPAPDADGRGQILAKMVRQLIGEHEVPGFRMFADDLDLAECAAISEGLTGADLKEVLRRAQLAKAMQEARTGVPSSPISQEDLRRRMAEVRTGRS
jgi:transitional endoplasmic reticulum ATPase